MMIDCSRTKNYLSEKNRITKSVENGICRIACINCPLSRYNNGKNMPCTKLEFQQPETAVKIVQKWSNAHPKKTYLSEFLQHYPDAELGDDGTPKMICPHKVGLNDIESCAPGEHHCTECWNQVID